MFDHDPGEDEDYFGVMARRSQTNERRVLWIGEIERKETDSDREQFRSFYFALFQKIIKYFRKKPSMSADRRMYLVKEPNGEWYMAFRERAFSRAFDEISQKDSSE